MDQHPLLSALDDMTTALRAHAEAVIAGRMPEVQDHTVLHFLATSRAFGEQMTAAGADWDWLFDPDAEAEPDDEVDLRSVARGETPRFMLTSRWDFLVHDEAAFVAYARDRLAAADPMAADVEHQVATASAAFNELLVEIQDFHEEWEEHGIEFSGGGWRVDSVVKTYWEMTEDEQDASGIFYPSED